MGFATLEILGGLIAAIGGVVIFMGINELLNPFLTKYSVLILLLGVTIIFLANKLQSKVGIKNEVSHTVGGVLVFLGIKNYLVSFVTDYTIIFLVVGAVLILFNKEFAKLVVDA